MSYLGMILLSLYLVFAWFLGVVYSIYPALVDLEDLGAEGRLLAIVIGVLMPVLLPVFLIWSYIRK